MPCHHYPSARPCLVSSLMTEDETNKKVAGSERHSPERSERLPLELVRGRTAAVQLCLEDKAVPPSQLPSKELPRSRQQRRRRMCNSVRACVRTSLHSPCSCPSPHMGWSNRFKAIITHLASFYCIPTGRHKSMSRPAPEGISHLQDAQDLVPGLGHAQDLVRPADVKSLLVPACTWICAFRLVYSKTLPGG